MKNRSKLIGKKHNVGDKTNHNFQMFVENLSNIYEIIKKYEFEHARNDN